MYNEVKLIGGPAHGTYVLVHDDCSTVRVVDAKRKGEITLSHRPPPFRALEPIYRYQRRPLERQVADYTGVEG